MRLRSAALTAGRIAAFAGVLGATATISLAAISIFNLKTQLETKVSVSIGSQLKLADGFGFDQTIVASNQIEAPEVKLLAVAAPRIRPIEAGPQEQVLVASAVQKPELAYDSIELAITFDESDEVMEDLGMNTHALTAMLRDPSTLVAKVNTQPVVRKRAESAPKAATKKAVATQVAAAPAEEIKQPVSNSVDNVAGIVAMPTAKMLLALNDTAPGAQLGYSDAIKWVMGDVKDKANSEAKTAAKSPAPAAQEANLALDMPAQVNTQASAVAAQDAAADMTKEMDNQPALNTQAAEPAPRVVDVKAFMAETKEKAVEGTAGPQQLVALNQPESKPAPVATEKAEQKAAAKTEPELVVTVPAVQTLFSGKVVEAFTGGARPVANAEVQILGTQWVVRTDVEGRFAFNDINVDGVLPVVITKKEYLKRRVDLVARFGSVVELVSENSVGMSAMAAGQARSPSGGFIYGQLATLSGEPLDGMKVEISGPGMPRPVYVDANGIPNFRLTATSSRGQFMVLNANAGTYLVAATDSLGRERAPHIVHLGENEGLVRKFSLGEEKYIKGRVLNAAANGAPVDKAHVQLLGSLKTAQTASDGRFTLGPVFVDCASPNYVQFEKPGYYRNRVDFACSGAAERAFYVFPAAHLDAIAVEANQPLDANTGIVMGHASFKASVKMQLWGPEELNPESGGSRGKDFYFDKDGILNPSRNRTGTNGNFTILDAPDGLSYMQAFSKDNKTLSFWPIYISPSTVNVYVQ